MVDPYSVRQTLKEALGRKLSEDTGSGWKTLKVTGWYWKILNVADSSRMMVVNLVSGWKVLEVTEGFSEGGLFQMES